MAGNKLQKTAEVLEALRRILTSGLWLAVFIIILASIGWFISNTQNGDRSGVRSSLEKVIKPAEPPIDWSGVDASVAAALRTARLEARRYAEAELDKWIADMMERVDSSFLDWYFSYWTQQVLGLKGLYQYGVHYVMESQPTASEKLTEEIQEEFSARVLRPQIAQRVLERIIQQTASRYIASLQENLAEIPSSYGLSKVDWQEYLEDIAVTAEQTNAGRSTPLTLKALTVSGVGGTALLAAKMSSLVGKIGSKVMTKSTGKVASKMAAKTGGKVAAKVGGKFFGTIAGLGVLIWDLWDHSSTRKHNRPLLRSSLQDYFTELKALLLDDPEFGIMATFHEFEKQLAERKSSS